MNTELLDLARRVALEAGSLIARRRREGVSIADHKSSPVDVVTAADRESEAVIRSLIADARPQDGFFGEEGSTDDASRTTGTSGLTWVVDPIDGTVNYLYDYPQYAVSIAVVEGEADPLTWTALAGCVYGPPTDELFTATAGGGAFLGDTRLAIAPATTLAQALVGTGFSYDATNRGLQGAVLAKLLPEVRDMRRGGSAALDLCYVAMGRLNAYYERGLQPWDHAAGGLIAREAGARVQGFDGVAASGEFLLAAEPELAAVLEKRLRDLGI